MAIMQRIYRLQAICEVLARQDQDQEVEHAQRGAHIGACRSSTVNGRGRKKEPPVAHLTGTRNTEKCTCKNCRCHINGRSIVFSGREHAPRKKNEDETKPVAMENSNTNANSDRYILQC
eukprot:gnl/MRDRNA2_/MRDRNA2_86508_c4_seq8.p1 gnl/MRDRNA2_/MRDRNA2_86508_c4~~gnl/MRDRNA2_/MRDRNA2_86508_c4_seq8.p1  ORF type:complete len:119 (-),score=7.45 gnl/MRDRNA2_/MRDRNA2_86508_c4_seq8:62-418(-)